MNMRKLVVFLAAAMLVVMPLSANALGFGRIKQHSALNEPLDADIELLSPVEDDIANLKVRLASADAFLRAGIDRNALLNELKFTVKELDSGKYVIHLSTRQPIREPFLNFLLEMDWQNGRMLREYTMLLDPPGLVKKEPTVIEPPTAAAKPAPAEAPVPAPAPFVPGPVDTPEASAPAAAPAQEDIAVQDDSLPPPTEAPAAEPATPDAAPAVVAETKTPEEKPADSATFQDDSELFPSVPLTETSQSDKHVAEAPAMASGDEGPMPGELDYGIVRKGDRLWNIAEKLRPNDSVSIYQVMMALLRSNPDAFVDGNVNRLKVGHVLRIEDTKMLTAMSRREAVVEFQAQNVAWEDYRSQFATATQPLIGSEVTDEDSGSADSSGELTLASPDGEAQSSGEGTNADAVNNNILTLQDELRQVREDASSMRGNNEALNKKLRDMEDQLSQMQRSISVKDDDLAAMQKKLAEVKDQTAEAVAADSAAAESAQPAPAADATQPVETTPAPEAPAPETTPPAEDLVLADKPATTPAESPAPDAPVAADQTAAPTGAGDTATTDAKDKGTAAPVPAPVPAPAVKDEGMMSVVMKTLGGIGEGISSILGGATSLLLFIGLPVVLVLIVLVMILMRRRKSSDAYQESILTGGPSSVTSSEAAAETEEESSFLSDFAVSGAGAIQTEDSEVDPLTEADVFMAYGRYEAAEDRLKEAIEGEPARAELKVKLLELYHVTKNRPAFENTAEAFYASLGDNASEDTNWQKIVAMGSELVPGSPLFNTASPAVAAAATAAPTTEMPAALTESQVMDIGLDTGVFEAADIGVPEAGAGDMDFNLDLGLDSDSEPAASDSAPEAEVSDALDFNLDLGEPTAAVEEPGSDTGSGLDFSLDLGSEASDLELDSDATATDDGGLEFNLDSAVSPELDSTESVEVESSADTMGMDFDLDLGSGTEDAVAEKSSDELLLDIGGDLGATTAADDNTLDFELDASDAGGDLDIGGGDEVGTKLDLAKAYIDMGDPDGARGILDEVMDEGDDSQKQEAQELMQQIA